MESVVGCGFHGTELFCGSGTCTAFKQGVCEKKGILAGISHACLCDTGIYHAVGI